MSMRVDPGLREELEAFGLRDADKCFHCSTCTVTCPLSTEAIPFPRKLIRSMQLGLKERILRGPEPWLCYYCGDCSSQCPRGAEPGETMMVARRYLTSLYDWTGFSRKFYTSGKFEISAVAYVALLVGLVLLFFNTGLPDWEHADINSLWPARYVERADLVMAAVLGFLLLGNVSRCAKAIMGDNLFKIPLSVYGSQLKEFVVHALTQKNFNQCSDRKQWIVHLLIMTGYATIFLLVVVLLNGLSVNNLKFQRGWPEYPLFHPIRLLGYYATFAIMYGTTYALIGRLKKSKPVYKHSHPTDWMFLILLQLTAMTGIFINFARLLDWPATTYGLYVIHMMVAVPMLLLEVPFSKWAHLAYRPLVLYLMKVKEQYQAQTSGATLEV
jgi:quinone-modifying oxidoreductase subunit QmoC